MIFLRFLWITFFFFFFCFLWPDLPQTNLFEAHVKSQHTGSWRNKQHASWGWPGLCWWQTYGSEPIKKWDTEDHWNRRWIDGLPSIMIGTNLVIQWSLHDSAAKRLSPNEVFKLYYMHQVECHCILSVVLTCFHLLYTWKLSGFSI